MNVLIIGCGAVAQGYDSPDSQGCFTHIKAYKEASEVKNIYLYDIDHEYSKNVASKWNVYLLESLDSKDEMIFDIISICVPTSFHESIFEKIISKKTLPKVIWLEKPASGKSLVIEKMYHRAKEKKVEVFVNYIRRFDPQIIDVKNNIESKKYGEIVSVKGSYGKGFVNNGSHLINIIQYFFGEIFELREMSRVVDSNLEDPTIIAYGNLKNHAAVYLEGIASKNFTIFELELIFEKARIKFLNSFFEYTIEFVENDPLVDGYKVLGPKKLIKTDLMFNMKNVLDYIIGYLKKEKLTNISDLSETNKTITACEAVLTRKRSHE